MRSCHTHNENKTIEQIVEMTASNKSVAVVSDTGTPAISDPGFLLVRECIKQKVLMEILPGAMVFVLALVSNSLPYDSFVFYGF